MGEQKEMGVYVGGKAGAYQVLWGNFMMASPQSR